MCNTLKSHDDERMMGVKFGYAVMSVTEPSQPHNSHEITDEFLRLCQGVFFFLTEMLTHTNIRQCMRINFFHPQKDKPYSSMTI